ncbi:hypothetical protein V500_07891 [Pseudogymnoascus sp. VKM F-4518 (FW-2643)]|nr:hypothetical protein V500_07891 [Pseudogymnoascus sp. VKM F-4518 (FW-2643)]
MASLFTRDVDFELTWEVLQSTLEAGGWKRPLIKSTSEMGLNTFQRPDYIPMGQLIAQNTTEPMGTPHFSWGTQYNQWLLKHRLAQGIEFLYHDISGRNLEICVPRLGIDAAVDRVKLERHVSNVTKKTLQRGRDVAKMLVLDNVDTKQFRDAMRATTDGARQLYIRSLVTEDIVYYIFSTQFESVSFPFIFHRGIRRIAAEEAIRRDLYTFTTFVAGTLIYDTYRLCLQMDARKPTLIHDDIPLAHDIVRINYKTMVRFSPLGDTPKKLEDLPANPELLLNIQSWKPDPHSTAIQLDPNADWSHLLD